MGQMTCTVRRDDMENRIAALRKERRISQAELAADHHLAGERTV